METLTCSVGPHSFERERKHGRKPTLCPAHRDEVTPVAQPEPDPTEPNPFLAGLNTSASINKKMDTLEHAREVKKEKHEGERAGLIRRAREAKLEPEKRRQADYIIAQMEGPRQDVAHLVARLNEILRTHKRGRR